MDLRKLAKILKNSNFETEDEIFSVLENKDSDFFKKYVEDKNEINYNDYKKRLRRYKRKENELINEEEMYYKQLWDDFEKGYHDLVMLFKRGKRKIQTEQYMKEEEQKLQERKKQFEEQQKLLQEQQQMINEQILQLQNPSALIGVSGVNKSQKLNYINVMTQRNFDYGKDPKANPKPLKEDPRRLINKLVEEIQDKKLPANTKFFLNFDGVSGHKTYKSGITLAEIEVIAETIDMNDGFFEEYKFDNTVYGISVAYR